VNYAKCAVQFTAVDLKEFYFEIQKKNSVSGLEFQIIAISGTNFKGIQSEPVIILFNYNLSNFDLS
jgi:hypothetical protein